MQRLISWLDGCRRLLRVSVSWYLQQAQAQVVMVVAAVVQGPVECILEFRQILLRV